MKSALIFKKEDRNRNFVEIEKAFDFIKGVPIYLPVLKFIDAVTQEDYYYLLSSWMYDPVSKYITFDAFDFQDNFKLVKDMEFSSGTQYLTQMDIFIHKEYALMQASENASLSCQEFYSELIPTSLQAYCNYKGRHSVCQDNEFLVG